MSKHTRPPRRRATRAFIPGRHGDRRCPYTNPVLAAIWQRGRDMQIDLVLKAREVLKR